MKVAAIGQKGGSGKTTLVLSLAVEWQRRGSKVLVGDADPQRSALTWASVAAGEGVGTPTVIGLHSGLHRKGQLPDGYDVTLIDTPARLADVSRAALFVCDVALIPVSSGGIETWALSATLECVQQAKIMRPDLFALIVLNRASRTALSRASRAALAESGLPIADTELAYRVAYQESLTAGKGPTTWEDRKASQEVKALVDEVERRFRDGKASTAA